MAHFGKKRQQFLYSIDTAINIATRHLTGREPRRNLKRLMETRVVAHVVERNTGRRARGEQMFAHFLLGIRCKIIVHHKDTKDTKFRAMCIRLIVLGYTRAS